jgi:putative Mg2+ transporter-C (MgtC) family protein
MSYALAITLSWNAELLLRLLVAAILGGLIGAEREHHGRSAGFRTQMLVALGSALAMVVSLHFGQVYGDRSPAASAIRVDPARVAYSVMAGIGFLGAGAIIRYGTGVRGLTTAASLWCTAAVGLACGFGMYALAVIATAIVIFALMVLSRLDHYIPSRWYKTVTVSLPSTGADNVSRLSEIIAKRGARVLNVQYSSRSETKSETITFNVVMPARTKPSDLMDLVQDVPEVTQLTIR